MTAENQPNLEIQSNLLTKAAKTKQNLPVLDEVLYPFQESKPKTMIAQIGKLWRNINQTIRNHNLI